MIGEVIKLGFDGSAVSRGIKGVTGGFSRLRKGIGSVTKQIGTGIGRQAGYSLFGAAMKGLSAIPNELKNLAALNKEIETMGLSTGITAERYLALRDAISKTTGLDSDEATDFVRDVSERLGEAMTDFESTPRKAMIKMGIRVGDIRGMNIDDQMKVIGQKFKEFQRDKGNNAAMFQINELLGEIGKKMAPLFLDYDKGMDSASERTKVLASQIKDLGGDLDGVNSITAAFNRKFSEISLGVMKGLTDNGGSTGGIAKWIEGIDAKGFTGKISASINSEMDSLKEHGIWGYIGEKIKQFGSFLKDSLISGANALWEWFKSKMGELSQWIGSAITKGIKDGLPSFLGGGEKTSKATSMLDAGRSVFSSFKTSKTNDKDPTTAMIESNTSRTNVLLERMTDTKTISTFA